MQSNIYLLHRVSTNSLHDEEFIFESEYVSHADIICLNLDDKFSLSITFVLLYSSNSLQQNGGNVADFKKTTACQTYCFLYPCNKETHGS